LMDVGTFSPTGLSDHCPPAPPLSRLRPFFLFSSPPPPMSFHFFWCALSFGTLSHSRDLSIVSAVPPPDLRKGRFFRTFRRILSHFLLLSPVWDAPSLVSSHRVGLFLPPSDQGPFLHRTIFHVCSSLFDPCPREGIGNSHVGITLQNPQEF